MSEVASAPADAPDDRIACTIADVAETCTFERTATADGALITVRHPDGGFRRLRIGPGGEITAADGAERAVVQTTDGMVDVTVGDARYRLPRMQ